jgi:hypothetical protein
LNPSLARAYCCEKFLALSLPSFGWAIRLATVALFSLGWRMESGFGLEEKKNETLIAAPLP